MGDNAASDTAISSEPDGCARRLSFESAVVVFRPRDDAPDEGYEQQQINGREPGRVVNVEQSDGVEEREPLGVVALPLDDAVGVGASLRKQ